MWNCDMSKWKCYKFMTVKWADILARHRYHHQHQLNGISISILVADCTTQIIYLSHFSFALSLFLSFVFVCRRNSQNIETMLHGCTEILPKCLNEIFLFNRSIDWCNANFITIMLTFIYDWFMTLAVPLNFVHLMHFEYIIYLHITPENNDTNPKRNQHKKGDFLLFLVNVT